MILQTKTKKYWDGIKNEIKTINGGKEGKYDENFMKIKFDTDDNLPLNKLLKLHMLIIIVRSVFEEGGKFYPQIYLAMIQLDRNEASEGIDFN